MTKNNEATVGSACRWSTGHRSGSLLHSGLPVGWLALCWDCGQEFDVRSGTSRVEVAA